MSDAVSAASDPGEPAGEHAALPVRAAQEALTVRRVFGEPFHEAGVTVLPVARLRGTGGMGFGRGPAGTGGSGQDEGSGGGGGFGVAARPAGVYVIADGAVSWQPALDINRAVLGGQVLGAMAVLAFAWAWGRRR